MQKSRVWFWGTIFLTIGIAALLILFVSVYQKELTAFTLAHPILAPFIIILFRMIAMVIPPIPGGILSFALIPVLGWFWSYVYAVIGITLGASIAFFIARKFREPLVAKFVPLQQLHEREEQLSHKTEFTTFLVLRMTTGPIMDIMSYIAGLTKISFKKFLLATLLAEIPSLFGYYLYYVGGKTYSKLTGENSGYFGLFLFVLIAILYYFFKDHELMTGVKKEKKRS